MNLVEHSDVGRRAKHAVEQQRVEFFDFFRRCAFGFVRSGPRKGFFAHVAWDGREWKCHCRCRHSDISSVCEHGLALFLVLMDWPHETKDLSSGFDQFVMHQLLRSWRHQLQRGVERSEAPELDFQGWGLSSRFLAYAGLVPGDEQLAARDRKAMQTARDLQWSAQEKAMRSKGMASARISFEDSAWYHVAKALYWCDRRFGLSYACDSAGDHCLRFSVSPIGTANRGQPLFVWDLPVSLWIRSAQNLKQEIPLRRAIYQRRALPVVHRLGFSDQGDLEIEPFVRIGAEQIEPLQQLVVEKENLHFHSGLGYFKVSTGLSPFELSFSEPGIHRIAREEVPAFLKTHQEILNDLDPSLIDPVILKHPIQSQVDGILVFLDGIRQKGFVGRLEMTIGGQNCTGRTLGQLLQKPGRFQLFAGRLVDSCSLEFSLLKDAVSPDTDSVPISFSRILQWRQFFADRVQWHADPVCEARLRAFEREPQLPEIQFAAFSLRPYQQQGYRWMRHLAKHHLGGLLCDQMGVGKTHQAMALLASILSSGGQMRALVVAPRSVYYHWQDLLNRFLPEVPVLAFHGTSRDPTRLRDSSQLVLTTYGILRQDLATWETIPFNLAVFDEIQVAKNRETQVHKALTAIRAETKFGLTGTPIENAVTELRNLLEIVLPGFLGDHQMFRRFFEQPIRDFQDTQARARLRKLTGPLILRRTKELVLPDLPPKNEDILPFDLSPYERSLYDAVRDGGLKGLKSCESRHRFTHVFQLIVRLKQLCDHPALFHGADHYRAFPSAKWDLFVELLENLLDSGDKVVVFSQYLGMIDLIQQYLNDQGIGHVGITGRTVHRDEMLRTFREDKQTRVFVGTTKAGGVGIDLTSASAVIHYDRWWTAAQEDQATDRLHRMGQCRPVNVYKLLARNTLEERIHELIESKRGLMDDFIESDATLASRFLSLDALLRVLGVDHVD